MLSGGFEVVLLSQNLSVSCKILIKQHMEFRRDGFLPTYVYMVPVDLALLFEGIRKGRFKFFIISTSNTSDVS
jgi:hypothetical protein